MKTTEPSKKNITTSKVENLSQRSMCAFWRAWVALLLVTAGMVPAARASTWYLQANQAGSDSWSSVADWYSQPLGGGSHPGSILSTDDFDNNSYTIRTPVVSSGTVSFGGKSLTLHGGLQGSLLLKTISPAVCVVANLNSFGAAIGNGSSGTLTMNITNFANYGNTTFNPEASTRSLNIVIGTLSGDGDLSAIGDGGGGVLLAATSAANFYGTLYVAGGCHFTFQNAMTSGGGLYVETGSTVTLNATVTFSGLTVNGTAKSPGTYSAASLGFSGSGSIVVRAPASWYLHASMGLTDTWNTLADWFSTPTGGSNPTSISANDDFSTNGFTVRTPNNSSAATFGGAILSMDGGEVLLKDTSTSTATTIDNLVSNGGTIGNGTGGNLILNVADFQNLAATTFDAGTNTRGFNLGVVTLTGAGNFTFLGHGGGGMLLNVTDAYGYTGTVIFSSSSTGLVTFENDLFTSGSLNIGGGNTVVLNTNVTAAGLTVAGTAKTAGTYSASTLGFSGTGSITVQNRPTPMFGTNLPGGSFKPTQFYPTDALDWDYLQGKGLKLVRVAFLWEQVQPTLNGALNTTVLGKLDTVLSLANARGMKVILDMHNYDRYTITSGTTSTTYLIGSTQVPYSAYQDAWDKLATHFAASPDAAAIYGYDIMNEPHDTGGTWATAAQYGVNGVRQGDTTHFVIVEGDSWAGAQGWTASNANLNVTDSAKRVMYEAHSYWGSNHNDSYGTYDAEHGYPNMGVDQLAPFVHWLKVKKAWGLVGEFGVPNNVSSPDARWNVMLDNAMKYLAENGVSTTYWSMSQSGWPDTYSLLCATHGKPPGPVVDAPAMQVLQNYHE